MIICRNQVVSASLCIFGLMMCWVRFINSKSANKHLKNIFHENQYDQFWYEEFPDIRHKRRTFSSDFPSQWPRRLRATSSTLDPSGDILIGGLHMVHERNEDKICGRIMPQGGLQAAEVMLYTIDMANKLVLGVKQLTIDTIILDDCDRDTYGLQQATEFIKGSISNIEEGGWTCKDGSAAERESGKRVVVSGVVGASSSVTSIQVANLLRLFKIPQISFFSTSPELSNKQRFEYFSRTIPSDHFQTLAMAELVKLFGWKYISVVYEESSYGEKAYEELFRLLQERGICLAVTEKLPKDSGVAGVKVYDDIVKKLLNKKEAKGVIIYGSDQEVAELMRAVSKNNATGYFTWIGSDGWSARSLVSQGQEECVEGTISFQPQAHPVQGFKEYFLGLTPHNNLRNPWFIEFWEDHFSCRYPGSAATPFNTNHTRNCSGKEKLTAENTEFEAQLQFVSDAVMAFAHAFRDMHEEVCGLNFKGLCARMDPINGEELLGYLRKVNFTGLSNDEFTFDAAGDGPARYNIIHYRRVGLNAWEWVKVGTFKNEKLDINMSELMFPGTGLQASPSKVPTSMCSQECPTGKAKKYHEGESCCWDCFLCAEFQIVGAADETLCILCPQGTLPNKDKTFCNPLPEVYLNLDSTAAFVAISFSFFGIIFTILVLAVFMKNHSTPVVRASGRELSYVLLFGLLLCFSVTFLLVLRPSTLICALQRFSIGLCFSIVYAALLVKTNRIQRIFNSGQKSSKKIGFISPSSQLAICGSLVLVQVILNLVWLISSPPVAIFHHPTRYDNFLVCKASVDLSYMITFSYPILLVIVCTIYAVLTRKIPEAFNESKFIGFSMYTTCVIWLAFVPIYISTSGHMRITSMSITISLSATVCLVTLFSPKLYIILLHPEKNIRTGLMTTAKYKKESTPEVKPCLNGQNGVTNHRVTNSTQTREEVNCHSSTQTINGVIWQDMTMALEQNIQDVQL